MKTLTLNDIAALLHMEPRSVQNRLYTAPETLPKPLAIPGKKKLWLEDDVIEWLKQHRDGE